MSADGKISLQVNGDQLALPADLDLPSLIAHLGLPAAGVLVEHNGTALLRAEWPAIRLIDGDRLEILRVVAGG